MPADLRALYDEPRELVLRKVLDHVDRHCRRFIELSPFCCLATADAAGHADASPRGDEPGFVRVLDERRLLLPDRLGNNRLDSLRNLQESPHAGLMFLIPGIHDILRVNGRAEIVDDAELLVPSAMRGKLPKTGLLIHVEEVFLHCGRAIKRARLWDPDVQLQRGELPTLAQMIRDQVPSCDADSLDGDRYLHRLY